MDQYQFDFFSKAFFIELGEIIWRSKIETHFLFKAISSL